MLIRSPYLPLVNREPQASRSILLERFDFNHEVPWSFHFLVGVICMIEGKTINGYKIIEIVCTLS